MSPYEAAARAWFDRQQKGRMDAGRKRPDGSLWQWDDLRPEDHRAYLAIVEPIVDAALNAIPDTSTQPDIDGGIELTNDEYLTFIRAARA